MSELSREQVEELADDLAQVIWEHRKGHTVSNSPYGHICEPECLARTLARTVTKSPTVSAMLDQARAEGAAAVVAALGEGMDLERTLRGVTATLARNVPAQAPEGPSEARGGAGGVVGSGEAQGAAERRTGPQSHLPDPGRKERR